MEQANKCMNGSVNQKVPAQMTNGIEVLWKKHVLEIWSDINFTTHLLLKEVIIY